MSNNDFLITKNPGKMEIEIGKKGVREKRENVKRESRKI